MKRRRVRLRLPDGSTTYRVVRPVFEGALQDLKRGVAPNGERLDGLVVYDIDRLTRDNRHLEDAIEVVQHYGRPILDFTDTLDLLTDNGRTVARILVATSNKQSADTARRVARKHHAMQQAGIPTGGRRPFGWKADKRTLDPKESEAVRAAARRFVAGEPLTGVDILAAGHEAEPLVIRRRFLHHSHLSPVDACGRLLPDARQPSSAPVILGNLLDVATQPGVDLGLVAAVVVPRLQSVGASLHVLEQRLERRPGQ